MNNIKQNMGIDLMLLSDKYWDGIVVNAVDCVTLNDYNCHINKVVSIDIGDNMCRDGSILVSNPNSVWGGAINDGVTLTHIGLTGVDNGLIHYNKDDISNVDFLTILTKSEYPIDANNYQLRLNPIKSNSKFYTYKYIDNGDYFSLKGGFFQGFYKTEGCNYSVLPSTINDEWVLEFGLRSMDYQIEGVTANTIHPNNNGIFFYMGARAENKFWELYDSGDLTFPFINRNDYVTNYVCDDYVLPSNNVLYEPYLRCIEDTPIIWGDVNDDINNTLSDWVSFVEDKFIDPPLAVDNGCYVEDEYIDKPLDLDSVVIKTDDGYDMNQCNIYEIITDNKFLLFNQTKDGYTTNDWVDGHSFKYTGIKTPLDLNYFLLFNQTKGGYTTKTIQEYLDKVNNAYNPINDITNNAFALRIDEFGAIGYRYIISNSDISDGYEVLEEYSKSGLIKKNEWVDIKVRIKSLQGYNECFNCNQKIKLYFYVNGYLVFISKELPMFNFRALNDISEKQEGVPYNISLGGGTIGLMERVWLDYYKLPYHILPIEKNFSGSFIGDISYFNFLTRENC